MVNRKARGLRIFTVLSRGLAEFLFELSVELALVPVSALFRYIDNTQTRASQQSCCLVHFQFCDNFIKRMAVVIFDDCGKIMIGIIISGSECIQRNGFTMSFRITHDGGNSCLML